MHQLWQNKEVRVFIWQTFNGVMTLIITVLGQINFNENFVYLLPLVYATLNAITKRVNVVVFKDLGVNDKKG